MQVRGPSGHADTGRRRTPRVGHTQACGSCRSGIGGARRKDQGKMVVRFNPSLVGFPWFAPN
jgi:hypothetical protein